MSGCSVSKAKPMKVDFLSSASAAVGMVGLVWGLAEEVVTSRPPMRVHQIRKTQNLVSSYLKGCSWIPSISSLLLL